MYPYFCRYWKWLPAQGSIGIFLDNWYRGLFRGEKGFKSAKDQTDMFRRVAAFERALTDSKHLIVKFYLYLSEKEQKDRLKKLAADSRTSWRVTKRDWQMLKRFDRYKKNAVRVIEKTGFETSPWTTIAADDWRQAALTMTRTLVDAMEKTVEGNRPAPSPVPPDLNRRKPAVKLADVDLSLKLEREQYDKELDRLRRKLRSLHSSVYRKRVPVAVAYEGWDAAGKGGNIRRLASGLDPRGYRVIPIAAPTADEKAHHYLWRFWNQAPRRGHIAIFDRTWYGRVLVEKVEGFCSPEECERAYTEIVEMEREWAQSGVLLLKFWLHLSPEEQLRRFKERQETPHKQWKITDEDWRNREKWNDYAAAVDVMLERTSTKFAPWTVVESDSKLYARIKVLRTVLKHLEARL